MSRDDRPIVVYRCICTGHTFASALAESAGSGAKNVAELQEVIPIGTGCGRCIPYVQRTLETGEVGHPLLDDTEADRLIERSGVVLEPEDGRGEAE